jgi:hypothetical protein
LALLSTVPVSLGSPELPAGMTWQKKGFSIR